MLCPLAARDARSAVQELTALLERRPGVIDRTALALAVEAREHESSTYLGSGIAVPHARTDAVDRIVVAVGAVPGGVAWPAAPHVARLVFLVGVPRLLVREYLELLRRITKAARQPGWVEAAANLPDAAGLAAWLRKGIGG